MNSVTIIGHLTRDIELRFLDSGQVIANTAIADNYTPKNGEERVTFIDVTAFGSLAENCAASLSKGDRVIAVGRLETQTWDTDAGEKRSKTVLIADEVAPALRFAEANVTKNQKAAS